MALIKQWRYFFSIHASDEVREALENHPVFGQDEPPGWYRSRGRLRSMRRDPRWSWTQLYEVFPTGFMCDDGDIAFQFICLMASLEPSNRVAELVAIAGRRDLTLDELAEAKELTRDLPPELRKRAEEESKRMLEND